MYNGYPCYPGPSSTSASSIFSKTRISGKCRARASFPPPFTVLIRISACRNRDFVSLPRQSVTTHTSDAWSQCRRHDQFLPRTLAISTRALSPNSFLVVSLEWLAREESLP